MDVNGPEFSPRSEFSSVTPHESGEYDLTVRVSSLRDRYLASPVRFSPAGASPSEGVTRVDLDALALPRGAGVGYKAANLVQLERLASDLGVLVPPFIMLGHHQLMEYITASYPDFQKDYMRFVTELRVSGSLTPECKIILREIRKGIKDALSSFEDHDLVKWLEGRKSSFVIVRSTGKEDSDELSNAGGNASIPFTKRTVKDVALSMGKVVASYFSEKSIGQRLSSKDPTLFTDVEPFVPVLIQEQIDGGTDHIPRSGVLVTGSGVSVMSVGPGLNEGVVTSSISTDTYRFLPEGDVAAAVVPKKTRFAGLLQSSGEMECKPVTCEGSMVANPILTLGQRRQMQNIAKAIHQFYGKPMDVEFTIVDGQVYLLQARPLLTPPPKKPPSYLAVRDAIRGEAFLPGGCYVCEIERKEQVLICKTIPEAYNQYDKLSTKEQEEVKGIIIREEAPLTSHQAVFFKRQGLAIVIIAEGSLEPPFYLDPQQGLIAKEAIIQEGYTCYPMPLQYSLVQTDLVKAMEMQLIERTLGRGNFIRQEFTELEDRIGEVRAPITSVLEMRERLEIMKLAPLEEAEAARKAIAQYILRTLKKPEIVPRSRIEMVMVLENLMRVRLSGEPMTLERLYGVRLIEACLFQDGKGIIGGFSFVRSMGAIRDQRVGSQALGRPQSEETFRDIPFVKMQEQIMQEELKARFGERLTHLSEVDPALKQRVLRFFLRMDHIGAGTSFANVTLIKLLRETRDVHTLFAELDKLGTALLPTLKFANSLREFAMQERGNLSLWSNPEYLRTNIDRLETKLHELALLPSNPAMIRIFREGTPEQKLLLLQSIREVVETVDLLIKACTGSRAYSSIDAQVADFLRVLQPYQEMAQVIHRLAGKKIVPQNYALPVYFPGEALRKQFRISEGFNVSELIQEDVRYVTTKPVEATTLEEKFTLFHQMMLQDLSQIDVKNGISEKILPRDLLELSHSIQSDYEKMRLNSVKIEGNIIHVGWTVPLRDHGATLNFHYNRKKNRLFIELSFYGGNERNRWQYVKELASIISSALGVELNASQIRSNSLDIEFSNIELSKIPKIEISQMIQYLMRATYAISGVDEIETSLLKIVPERFQTKALVMQEVAKNGTFIRYAAEHFLEDDDVIAVALSQTMESMRFLSKERVLPLLRENGMLLEYVADYLLRDEEVVQTAITQNSDAAKFV